MSIKWFAEQGLHNAKDKLIETALVRKAYAICVTGQQVKTASYPIILKKIKAISISIDIILGNKADIYFIIQTDLLILTICPTEC